jgi:hypothetical protein
VRDGDVVNRFYSPAAAVGAAILTGLVALFVGLSTNGLAAASNWAAVLGAVVALIALLLTLFSRRSARFDESNTEDFVKTMLRRATPRPDAPYILDLSLRVEPGNEKIRSQDLIHSYVSKPTQILIVGPPGAGKSSLLSRLAAELGAATANDESKYIPILVQASHFYLEDAPSFDEYLQDQLTRMYGIRQSGLIDAILSSHPVLPLIDGLDEIQPEYRYQVLYGISRWLSKERNRPAVLSSREGSYHEILSLIQVDSTYFIEPLSVAEAVSLLRRLSQSEAGNNEVHADRTDDSVLIPAIAENENLRQPAILALLISLLRTRPYQDVRTEHSDALFEGVRQLLEDAEPTSPPTPTASMHTESRVLDAMEPEVSYDIAQISSAAGLPPSLCREALESLTSAGLVREVADSRGLQRFMRTVEARRV